MLFVGISAGAAAAHPHVWVTARAQVVFNAQGQIEAIRNAWVFDEMYSAFATQGLGKDGQLLTKDELAPLAKTNVEFLAEFDYFTYAKAASQKIEFGAPGRLFAGTAAGQARGLALHPPAKDSDERNQGVFVPSL